jgi:hypothetical protein
VKTKKTKSDIMREKINLILWDQGIPGAADFENADLVRYLEYLITESTCPGICRFTDCDYIGEFEQDSTDGYCEECQKSSCVSLLILLGLI